MSPIERYDVSEEWAHAGLVKAGDLCFLSYCVVNIGGTMEEQVNGAFDQMDQGAVPRKISRPQIHTDQFRACRWRKWASFPG